MPAKNKAAKATRAFERRLKRKNRVPTQPDGQPQGKHLGGWKGMKVDEPCNCGRCNPAAAANRNIPKSL